jgi:two-component system sensor histidine kinase KdpD
VQQALERHRVVTAAVDTDLVHVDPRLTASALAHLLENAAQYSPPATTIRIAAIMTGGFLEIVVEDEGPGIAASDASRLFERFFRGQASAGRPAGAGMGLAISRGLLAAEGGSVRGENRPGSGARFVITVPAETRPVVREAQD